MSQTLWTNAGGSLSGLSIPATGIPDDATALQTVMECSAWTDLSSSAAISIQISQDGGSTWGMAATFATRGGGNDLRTGQPLTSRWVSIGLPLAANRQMRASILVSGTQLITSNVSVVAI